jgi:hypothetical protein
MPPTTASTRRRHHVGTINPAVLNLTSTRVYDATTNADASLFGNNGVLTGVDGQTLTLVWHRYAQTPRMSVCSSRSRPAD